MRVCLAVCLFFSPYSTSGRQKKVLGFLGLETQAAVSCPVWVLGSKPRSSARASRANYL